MIARRRVDVALAFGAVVLALIVAIAGSDAGAAWVRWVLVVATVAVLARILTAGAPRVVEADDDEPVVDDLESLDLAIAAEIPTATPAPPPPTATPAPTATPQPPTAWTWGCGPCLLQP